MKTILKYSICVGMYVLGRALGYYIGGEFFLGWVTGITAISIMNYIDNLQE